ncbi:hypothetical protein GA0070624_5514 [Micromonospora rhizosphaerae]|uniref:Homeodomain-like domain-containing protein n=1 Tax=Micromonospora rhizosphaerae TaxID=568872 RepID=A0A1C6T4F0_9ACTN|nr:hypothetical protein GA0070624_5514 [Micromonospora rhizosphaerae]
MASRSAGSRGLREAAVRRLLELDAAGRLSSAHVQLTASSVGVAERTVWRWLEPARSSGLGAAPRPRFVRGSTDRKP